MKQYVLSIYQPDGSVPEPDLLAEVMTRMGALEQDMRSAGAWVFTAGLNEPSTATVVRLKDSDVLTTDGPYVEGKEHVGGFTVIQAPDLDAALGWAGQMARALSIDGGTTSIPVEVRPIADGHES
jgi:hypothetical protein